MTRAQGDVVAASLDAAVANGYELWLWSPREIAEDMAEYDPDFEDFPTADLEPPIQAWLDRQVVPVADLARHLVCVPFSVENLHKTAEALGIGRHWYHGGRHPHYDVPLRRKREIESRSVLGPSNVIVRAQRGELATIAAVRAAIQGECAHRRLSFRDAVADPAAPRGGWLVWHCCDCGAEVRRP